MKLISAKGASLEKGSLFSNLGFGLGLRAPHYADVLALSRPDPRVSKKTKAATLPQWFEALTENYLFRDSRSREILVEVSRKFPVALHGVSFSLGGKTPLEKIYRKNFRQLMEEVKPALISDHCCWTAQRLPRHSKVINSHDLLPIPYTKDALRHMIERTKEIQNFLGRRILVENVSSYIEFTQSQMPEYEFLAELSERADCGILLDINNVFVSAWNHAKPSAPLNKAQRTRLALSDSMTYIRHLPRARVGQYHLAGHKLHFPKTSDQGLPFRIDTHDAPLSPEVIQLFKFTWQAVGAKSTMIEWDDKIPSFKTLVDALRKLDSVTQKLKVEPVHLPGRRNRQVVEVAGSLKALQSQMLNGLVFGESVPLLEIKGDSNFSPDFRLNVYLGGMQIRFLQNLRDDFPRVLKQVGGEKFDELVKLYLKAHPSSSYTLFHLGKDFPQYLRRVARAHALPEFLPDLAELEYVVMHSKLQRIKNKDEVNSKALADQPFILAPQVQILESDFDLFRYWEKSLKRKILIPTAKGKQILLIFSLADERGVRMEILTRGQKLHLRTFGSPGVSLNEFFLTQKCTAQTPEFLIPLIRQGVLQPR